MNAKERLQDYFAEITRKDCAVAFSGGVDSSLILAMAAEAAAKNDTRILAVTFDTVLHPSADAEIAEKVARELQVEHKVLSVSELDNPEILHNPENRCYLCKKELFKRFKDYALKQGITVLLEGTNADDHKVYRPGIRAVQELGITSPLAQCKVTKEMVRKLAAEYRITVAERPSAPCMATRLPYGTEINLKLLERIDRGERIVRAMGFHNVRLRVHGTVVRLEVDRKDLVLAAEKSEEILQELKKLGFHYITLDLEGFRSGSMDEQLMPADCSRR